MHHVNDTDKVLAFHRFADGGPRDSVIVVANMANRNYDRYTIGVPRAGRWRVRFNSDWVGYDPDFGNQPSFDTTTSAARNAPDAPQRRHRARRLQRGHPFAR